MTHSFGIHQCKRETWLLQRQEGDPSSRLCDKDSRTFFVAVSPHLLRRRIGRGRRRHCATCKPTVPFRHANLLNPQDLFAEAGECADEEPLPSARPTRTIAGDCGRRDELERRMIAVTAPQPVNILDAAERVGECQHSRREPPDHADVDQDYQMQCEEATWILYQRIMTARQHCHSVNGATDDLSVNGVATLPPSPRGRVASNAAITASGPSTVLDGGGATGSALGAASASPRTCHASEATDDNDDDCHRDDEHEDVNDADDDSDGDDDNAAPPPPSLLIPRVSSELVDDFIFALDL